MKRTQTTADEVATLIHARRWQAIADRDRSLDGTFVFGVSSTGVFCRPSRARQAPAPRERNLFRRRPPSRTRPAIAPACAAVPKRSTETRNPRWYAPCAATSSSTSKTALTLGTAGERIPPQPIPSPAHLQVRPGSLAQGLHRRRPPAPGKTKSAGRTRRDHRPLRRRIRLQQPPLRAHRQLN